MMRAAVSGHSGPRHIAFAWSTYTLSADYAARYTRLALDRVESGEVESRLRAVREDWRRAHVLDLGCGPGTWAIPLRRLGAGTVVCHDISPVFLEYAKRLHGDRGIDDVEYVRRDLTDIPYPDASFDAVICNRALYHSSDEQWTIREVARVLRPGGNFYIESHSWRWLVDGYNGPIQWRIINATAPVFPAITGFKLVPTIFTWFRTVDALCRGAGLASDRRFDNGRENVFSAAYHKLPS